MQNEKAIIAAIGFTPRHKKISTLEEGIFFARLRKFLVLFPTGKQSRFRYVNPPQTYRHQNEVKTT